MTLSPDGHALTALPSMFLPRVVWLWRLRGLSLNRLIRY